MRPPARQRSLLSDHFGGAAEWEQRFRGLGASLGGGSGWAILELDLREKVPRMYSAGDHSQGLSSGIPLLVLDMYEHSYHMDYGTAASKYIDAFFANLHWEEIDRRTETALKVAEAFLERGPPAVLSFELHREKWETTGHMEALWCSQRSCACP